MEETPSLLSYTLRYVSLAELGTLCRVVFREPMPLCACVSEEGGDGEGVDLEASSLPSIPSEFVRFYFYRIIGKLFS